MRIVERVKARNSVSSLQRVVCVKRSLSQSIYVRCKLPSVLQDISPRIEAVSKSKGECRASHTIVGPMYNEEAFQYLLSSESKRSVRSRYSFKILLVYSIDKQGLIVQMDREVVDTVAEALFRTVRETDYIGWYLEGRIVGGVLTVLGQDSEVEVSARIKQRLMEIFRAEVSVEKNGRLQIRICQHHELGGIDYGKGNFTVN